MLRKKEDESDWIIIKEKPYSRNETARLIGASPTMLDRLIAAGKIVPSYYNNTRPVFLGKIIKKYRGESD